MVTLDFSKCKTIDDIDKVFRKEASALRNAKAMMMRIQNPEDFCPRCGKKIGVCKH